ncbi:MAG: cell division protein ZapB [Desulfuromonadaceae bacterium]
MSSDSLALVLKLERKVDRLLDRYQVQASELQQLREENRLLREERERFGVELDRILSKLDDLDGETP